MNHDLPLLGKVRTYGIVIALALGSAAVGCARNQADNAGDESAAAAQQPQASEAAVAEGSNPQERELALREREVAAREAELAQRARELEAQAQPSRTAPARSDRPATTRTALPASTEPRTVTVTLDAGTSLTVDLEQAVSSETQLVGDPVAAVVASDVVRGTRVIVPAGSRVLGSVSDVVDSKNIGGQARIAVAFDRLIMPSGQQVPIQAGIEAVGKSQKGKDAATIGGSTAGGALLGRALSHGDKGKATVLGAVVGAAVGTAVASKNNGDPVVLEPGTAMELVLGAPIDVAVQERANLPTVARN